MRTADLSVPLKIYEIGGGSGTCAKGIMEYIMSNAPPRVYNSMTYTLIEISSSLTEIQKETVGAVRTHLPKFKVECRDAVNRSGWDLEQQPCWVIMLEVLDNLPHDLIYSENQGSQSNEVWIQKQPDREELSEVYKPLQDLLIKRCVEVLGADADQSAPLARRILSKIFPKWRRSWLPTGCLKLLETLHDALHKMSLIASDFSYLPDVVVPGDRAPLVSTKKAGRSSDYNKYLDAKGDADIFFPTDFWLLERMDHYCSGWRQLHDDKLSKLGKKRRTLVVHLRSSKRIRELCEANIGFM